MPQSIPGSGIGQFRNPEMSGASDDGDLSQVLVVGRSPVNCVVVTRILERSGLKTASETPGTALDALGTIRPGTVILDPPPSLRPRAAAILRHPQYFW